MEKRLHPRNPQHRPREGNSSYIKSQNLQGHGNFNDVRHSNLQASFDNGYGSSFERYQCVNATPMENSSTGNYHDRRRFRHHLDDVYYPNFEDIECRSYESVNGRRQQRQPFYAQMNAARRRPSYNTRIYENRTESYIPRRSYFDNNSTVYGRTQAFNDNKKTDETNKNRNNCNNIVCNTVNKEVAVVSAQEADKLQQQVVASGSDIVGFKIKQEKLEEITNDESTDITTNPDCAPLISFQDELNDFEVPFSENNTGYSDGQHNDIEENANLAINTTLSHKIDVNNKKHKASNFEDGQCNVPNGDNNRYELQNCDYDFCDKVNPAANISLSHNITTPLSTSKSSVNQISKIQIDKHNDFDSVGHKRMETGTNKEISCASSVSNTVVHNFDENSSESSLVIDTDVGSFNEKLLESSLVMNTDVGSCIENYLESSLVIDTDVDSFNENFLESSLVINESQVIGRFEEIAECCYSDTDGGITKGENTDLSKRALDKLSISKSVCIGGDLIHSSTEATKTDLQNMTSIEDKLFPEKQGNLNLIKMNGKNISCNLNCDSSLKKTCNKLKHDIQNCGFKKISMEKLCCHVVVKNISHNDFLTSFISNKSNEDIIRRRRTKHTKRIIYDSDDSDDCVVAKKSKKRIAALESDSEEEQRINNSQYVNVKLKLNKKKFRSKSISFENNLNTLIKPLQRSKSTGNLKQHFGNLSFTEAVIELKSEVLNLDKNKRKQINNKCLTKVCKPVVLYSSSVTTATLANSSPSLGLDKKLDRNKKEIFSDNTKIKLQLNRKTNKGSRISFTNLNHDETKSDSSARAKVLKSFNDSFKKPVLQKKSDFKNKRTVSQVSFQKPVHAEIALENTERIFTLLEKQLINLFGDDILTVNLNDNIIQDNKRTLSDPERTLTLLKKRRSSTAQMDTQKPQKIAKRRKTIASSMDTESKQSINVKESSNKVLVLHEAQILQLDEICTESCDLLVFEVPRKEFCNITYEPNGHQCSYEIVKPPEIVECFIDMTNYDKYGISNVAMTNVCVTENDNSDIKEEELRETVATVQNKDKNIASPELNTDNNFYQDLPVLKRIGSGPQKTPALPTLENKVLTPFQPTTSRDGSILVVDTFSSTDTTQPVTGTSFNSTLNQFQTPVPLHLNEHFQFEQFLQDVCDIVSYYNIYKLIKKQMKLVIGNLFAKFEHSLLNKEKESSLIADKINEDKKFELGALFLNKLKQFPQAENFNVTDFSKRLHRKLQNASSMSIVGIILTVDDLIDGQKEHYDTDFLLEFKNGFNNFSKMICEYVKNESLLTTQHRQTLWKQILQYQEICRKQQQLLSQIQPNNVPYRLPKRATNVEMASSKTNTQAGIVSSNLKKNDVVLNAGSSNLHINTQNLTQNISMNIYTAYNNTQNLINSRLIPSQTIHYVPYLNPVVPNTNVAANQHVNAVRTCLPVTSHTNAWNRNVFEPRSGATANKCALLPTSSLRLPIVRSTKDLGSQVPQEQVLQRQIPNSLEQETRSSVFSQMSQDISIQNVDNTTTVQQERGNMYPSILYQRLGQLENSMAKQQNTSECEKRDLDTRKKDLNSFKIHLPLSKPRNSTEEPISEQCLEDAESSTVIISSELSTNASSSTTTTTTLQTIDEIETNISEHKTTNEQSANTPTIVTENSKSVVNITPESTKAANNNDSLNKSQPQNAAEVRVESASKLDCKKGKSVIHNRGPNGTLELDRDESDDEVQIIDTYQLPPTEKRLLITLKKETNQLEPDLNGIIDLTWLTDLNTDELKEQINQYLPVKKEEPPEDGMTNNGDFNCVGGVIAGSPSPVDGRVVISPSPCTLLMEELLNNHNCQCICGDRALLLCKCQSAMYCSELCWTENWAKHKPLHEFNIRKKTNV